MELAGEALEWIVRHEFMELDSNAHDMYDLYFISINICVYVKII